MDLKDKDMILPNQDELSNEDVVSFYDSFDNLLNLIKNNSKFTKNLFKMIGKGEKEIYNKTVKETKEYETTFLDTLEAAFPAFSKIAKNPKSSIKYEDDIVLVEKARKITSESIKHLASHSQNIREIKDDNVTPSKILTNFAEEDLAIYENRLYKTLVNNIVRFLTRREQILSENLESFRVDEIKYNNKLSIDENSHVDIGLSISLRKSLKDEIEASKTILNRTQALLLAYKGLKSTPFLRGLQNAKDVFPPIMKTNIILHNPDFKIVYNTWVFMERYSSVTFDVKVTDDDYNQDKKIEPDLNKISLLLFNTLLYHRGLNVEAEKTNDLIKNTNVTFNRLRNKEFDIKPGEIEIDDYAFSELFLSEASKYFEDDYKKNQANEVAKEISLKEAVRKMLQIINQIGPSVFGYKDNDLDEIGKDTKTLVKEANDRYEALRIYREEKEIDLEKNKEAERKAQEHLNKLKDVLALEEHETALEINKKDVEKLKDELQKEREAEEAAKLHQDALRKQNEALLKQRALEKELLIKSRGYHNRKHEKKVPHKRVPLQYYDSYEDSILDLRSEACNIALTSRRDYSNSNRLSLNDILDKLYLEEIERKKKQKEIDDLFFKAFKYRNNHTKGKDRERIKLQIKKKKTHKGETLLNLFDTPVHFDFFVQRRFDVDTIENQFRTIEPIIVKPKKIKKFIGIKKTVVKKKKLDKEEIKKITKKKVVKEEPEKKVKEEVQKKVKVEPKKKIVGSKKKLVAKKTIVKKTNVKK